MKNKTMKEIVGVVKAIKYIESLDENTSIISHTVNGMFHYIITETEVKQGENEVMSVAITSDGSLYIEIL